MPAMDIGEQEIHYRERGAGEALLIFPDDLHAAAAYEAEMAHLADRFRVLAFDMPGTGASTREVRYLDERAFDPWNFRADFACHLLLGLGVDRREHFLVRHGDALRRQHGEDWRAVIDADTAFVRGLADRGGYAIGEHVLNAVRCPTLLTGSLQNDVMPGIATAFARMAGVIPDCSIYLTSTAHHCHGEEHPLMWAAPETFRDVVDRFLAGVR